MPMLPCGVGSSRITDASSITTIGRTGEAVVGAGAGAAAGAGTACMAAIIVAARIIVIMVSIFAVCGMLTCVHWRSMLVTPVT
ncbi:hypothetical protein GCM10009102_35330 [Sphingomonas insulae]|uniref:Uncharacterized protein n=1 Tax=Sphingomonas insulae TaxID=424800 RepID=A0ABP3T469_9SPHN